MTATRTDKTPVIITRPEPDGSAFAAMIEAAGFAPVLSPVMTIKNTGEKPDLKNVSALAFTSANGVRAFAKTSEERSLPVFAVGAATEQAATEAGFTKVEAAEGDLPSLINLIVHQHEGGDILHVAGRDRAGDLVAALNVEGVTARRSVLYQAESCATLSTEAAAVMADTTIHPWVTLFSPRTADLFLDQIDRTGLEPAFARVSAACLSDAVAARLETRNFETIEIAEHRTAEAMIALITR